MSVECPKCRQDNSEAVQFCTRCHTPLRYVCPACTHVQAHGGSCDACGVDFAKYGMVQLAQMKTQLDREHERAKGWGMVLKHVLLAITTGGLSLFTLFRPRRPRE